MIFMDQNIFKSDRYFVVFDVVVSHGQLLLRSQKNDKHSSNIDIIFFDTTYIQLFTMLYGVSLKVIDKKEFASYPKVTQYLEGPHNRLFEIQSGEDKYYIAASFVQVYENKLDFSQTSLGVLSYQGRESELASFPKS